MPFSILSLAWVTAVVLGLGGVVVGAIHATSPNPADHTASVEACNGVAEIAAVIANNGAAVTALAGVQNSSGALASAAGNLPVTARTAAGEYVVTVGTGPTAHTCHIPIKTRSL